MRVVQEKRQGHFVSVLRESGSNTVLIIRLIKEDEFTG